MTDPATPLFQRDFDDLEPGDEFVTHGRTLTESDVVSFAGLTGDFHPQHLDAEWARSSRFGGRIAHGMLVLSAAAGLVPLDPRRVLALRRLREAVLKRPVHMGDTIHVEGTLDSVRQVSPDAGLADWRWEVRNQRAELVARVDVEVLWRRGSGRPADAASDDEAADPDEAMFEDHGAALVLPL